MAAALAELRRSKYPLKPLTEFASVRLPGQFVRIWADSSEYGIPYVNASDLMSLAALGTLGEKTRYLSRVTDVDIEALIIHEGWLGLSCSGTIGRVYYIPARLDGWVATHDFMRASMPAEQLFVEAAMMFLKEGGIMGIVLPDGILNNPGLRFLRSWLLKRARLIASIDLPKETFSVSGGVNNPSVPILQKFTHEQIQRANANIFDGDNMVFMSSPRMSGIDKRGKPIFLRHADGQEILDKNGNRSIDDEISVVAERFVEWNTNGIIG